MYLLSIVELLPICANLFVTQSHLEEITTAHQLYGTMQSISSRAV